MQTPTTSKPCSARSSICSNVTRDPPVSARRGGGSRAGCGRRRRRQPREAVERHAEVLSELASTGELDDSADDTPAEGGGDPLEIDRDVAAPARQVRDPVDDVCAGLEVDRFSEAK